MIKANGILIGGICHDAFTGKDMVLRDRIFATIWRGSHILRHNVEAFVAVWSTPHILRHKARMEAEKSASAVRSSEFDVYVMALGFSKIFTGLLPECVEVSRMLWDAGIKVQDAIVGLPALLNTSLDRIHIQAETQTPRVVQPPLKPTVILGEDEQAKGMVKIKGKSQLLRCCSIY